MTDEDTGFCIDSVMDEEEEEEEEEVGRGGEAVVDGGWVDPGSARSSSAAINCCRCSSLRRHMSRPLSASTNLSVSSLACCL